MTKETGRIVFGGSMSNSLFTINLRLEMIKGFLDRVCASCSEELEAIEKRKMAGEYCNFENYEHDHSLPFVHADIAARTVGYEIASLIESELHSLAREAWIESKKHKGPKNILDLDMVSAESLTKLKMISDLPFDDVIQLIERYYGIQLNKIDGWEDVRFVRATVNAFKHRQGFKHFREIKWGTKEILWKHEFDIEQAYEAIKNGSTFLLVLYKKIELMVKNYPSDRPVTESTG
jgi:hypothetical protein